MTQARPATKTLVAIAGVVDHKGLDLTAAALASLLRRRPQGSRPDGARGLARLSPVSRYVVDGPSMEPAYRAGDRLLVNRLAYRRHRPSAGDVVVLRDPEHPERVLVKRVALDVRCGETDAYVLGDNAGASRDSRTFGPVPIDRIIGRVWFRYWALA